MNAGGDPRRQVAADVETARRRAAEALRESQEATQALAEVARRADALTSARKAARSITSVPHEQEIAMIPMFCVRCDQPIAPGEPHDRHLHHAASRAGHTTYSHVECPGTSGRPPGHRRNTADAAGTADTAEAGSTDAGAAATRRQQDGTA